MKHTSLVFESQPDWLTAACHHRANSNELVILASELMTVEQRAGHQRRPFRLQGYQGHQAGRVRLGTRENAALVQLSGELAATQLHRVRQLQDSLTRLDIAVTCRPEQTTDVEAAQAYTAALAARADRPRLACPKLVCDGDGGSTLYIGDRTSDYLLRLYNKGAERRAAKDAAGEARYAGAWRYELEVKGEPAPALAKAVDEAPDQAAWVQEFLHRYCVNHGLTPLFPSTGARAILPGFTRRTDVAKTLAWYKASVSPSLRRLLSAGYDRDAYEALGIPLPPEPGETLTGL